MSDLLFLSSGARRRFLEDIIRTLALPKGGRLQFRYMKDIVSGSNLWEKLENNKLVGDRVLIAYLDRKEDQASYGAQPDILPCRYAKVVKSEVAGKFAVIWMEMGGFTTNTNEETSEPILSNYFNDLPHRSRVESTGEYEFKGKFCIERDKSAVKATEEKSLLESFPESYEITDWQNIVDQIGIRKDLNEEKFFALFQGLLDSDNSMLELKDGEFSVKAGKTYELKVIHYHPTHSDTAKEHGGWIICEGNGAVEVERNHFVEADTSYDINYARIDVGSVKHEALSGVSIYRHIGSRAKPEVANASYMFNLPLRIKGNHWYYIGLSLLLGLLLASQTMIKLFADNDTTSSDISASIISIVLGLITAFFAVYGIKKTI